MGDNLLFITIIGPLPRPQIIKVEAMLSSMSSSVYKSQDFLIDHLQPWQLPQNILDPYAPQWNQCTQCPWTTTSCLIYVLSYTICLNLSILLWYLTLSKEYMQSIYKLWSLLTLNIACLLSQVCPAIRSHLNFFFPFSFICPSHWAQRNNWYLAAFVGLGPVLSACNEQSLPIFSPCVVKQVIGSRNHFLSIVISMQLNTVLGTEHSH